jgi:hypothetical protein
MRRIINASLCIAFILICVSSIAAQSKSDCTPPNVFDYDDDETLTLDAETLLKEPKCYDGKFVRTFGFYSYGFEMSQLFCPNCGNGRRAWINTSNFYAAIKRCTLPENLKKIELKNGATLGIVVLGVFKTNLDFETQKSPKDLNSKLISESIGGYGHMGAYDSEFSPICFEEVEVFSKYMVTDDEKTMKRMKKWYEKKSEQL